MGAWYESERCAVCGVVIGKVPFWRTKPRKIGPGAVMVAASAPLTAGEFVVCGSCAFNRYGDVRQLVKRDG